MEDIIVYRTNSFTGNPNPFSDIIDVLISEPEQEKTLRSLGKFFYYDPEDPDSVGTMIKNMLGGFEYEQYFKEFMERSEDYRREFYARVVQEIREKTGVLINCCCWFSRKNIVLSRQNGYGRFLCKENGVLRCYDVGVVLVEKGFDALCAYERIPKLSPDVVTNNQLISRQQLNRLLELEETYGKILADTCLRKDVLNLLKRADKGLLGNSFVPSFEVQERRTEEERERIISDLL